MEEETPALLLDGRLVRSHCRRTREMGEDLGPSLENTVYAHQPSPSLLPPKTFLSQLQFTLWPQGTNFPFCVPVSLGMGSQP